LQQIPQRVPIDERESNENGGVSLVMRLDVIRARIVGDQRLTVVEPNPHDE